MSSMRNIIRLYHGSNFKVITPKIIKTSRTHDYGFAFYLTTDSNQAENWAKYVARKRVSHSSYVSVFELEVAALDDLKMLCFDKANRKWLQFIKAKRFDKIEDDYDIVIGPVADGKTSQVIRRLGHHEISEEEAIKQLKTYRLSDQFAIKTNRALSYLHFERYYEVRR